MKLYEKMRLLKENESGGYGDKWSLFSKDTEKFMAIMIPHILKNATLIETSIKEMLS